MTNHTNENTKPPMPPLSQLLDGYGGLTIKQYGILRDVGFTAEALAHKTQAFYTKMKPQTKYDTASGPATDLQLAYIKGRDVPLDIPLEDLAFGAARQVLRSLAKYDDDDAKYLQYIAGKEKDNAQRAERKRSKKSEPEITKEELATTPAYLEALAKFKRENGL